MADLKLHKDYGQQMEKQRLDPKEFNLPETSFVSDIDAKVFQGIVLQCLSQIDGVGLVEGNFISSLLGRGGPEVAAGIESEKDSISQSVNIKIEVNIAYGISIPQKAEEIQSKVAEEITRLTGLHVSSVHVIFRNILLPDQTKQTLSRLEQLLQKPVSQPGEEDEYGEDF